MGFKLNVAVFVITVLMTVATTTLMSVSVLTDHWEVVKYSLSEVQDIVTKTMARNSSVKSLYQDRVILVFAGLSTIPHEFMVQMHAGLWAICYDLTGQWTSFGRDITYEKTVLF